ncbi:MAG: DUF1569 domain-containing protein [Gammaproteobacteria bacterium]
MTMTRRKILAASLGTFAVGAVGTASWLATGPALPEPGIARALARLDQFDAGSGLSTHGAWSAFKVFEHLAQSVEMSIHGYPEHKSALFQRTAGAAAFAVFRKRGQMRHGLDEPIPGAPGIESDGDVASAMARLRTALLDFEAYQGTLAPHFAYGQLSREQYAIAHALHLDNHLLEFTTP